MAARIVTINTGSSSLKAALYDLNPAEKLVLTAKAGRIGLDDSSLRVTDAAGAELFTQQGDLPDHDAALQALFGWLQQQKLDHDLTAIGHRVVHGGSRYRAPHRITADLIDAVEQLVSVDPDHLPQALGAIRSASRAYPKIPQVACFDTTFHQTMPEVARLYALPEQLADAGIIRYGFHGLSYEYIMETLRAEDPAAANGRVIIAHLGNGASMAAVRNGRGTDTTMGFTPTGGLVMGTRSGDLDPGVLLYLLEARGMSASELSDLLNRRSGLVGLSGTSADMQDLLEREATDPRASRAVELFCYQARKFLGALAAALGGLETLVFTGGIGEHAAPIRERCCADLGFLGIQLDPARNAAHAPIISRADSPTTVRVIPTNEDLMIGRHTYEVISQRGEDGVSV